jgi:hypothetical protein
MIGKDMEGRNCGQFPVLVRHSTTTSGNKIQPYTWCFYFIVSLSAAADTRVLSDRKPATTGNSEPVFQFPFRLLQFKEEIRTALNSLWLHAFYSIMVPYIETQQIRYCLVILHRFLTTVHDIRAFLCLSIAGIKGYHSTMFWGPDQSLPLGLLLPKPLSLHDNYLHCN